MSRVNDRTRGSDSKTSVACVRYGGFGPKRIGRRDYRGTLLSARHARPKSGRDLGSPRARVVSNAIVALPRNCYKTGERAIFYTVGLVAKEWPAHTTLQCCKNNTRVPSDIRAEFRSIYDIAVFIINVPSTGGHITRPKSEIIKKDDENVFTRLIYIYMYRKSTISLLVSLEQRKLEIR